MCVAQYSKTSFFHATVGSFRRQKQCQLDPFRKPFGSGLWLAVDKRFDAAHAIETGTGSVGVDRNEQIGFQPVRQLGPFMERHVYFRMVAENDRMAIKQEPFFYFICDR